MNSDFLKEQVKEAAEQYFEEITREVFDYFPSLDNFSFILYESDDSVEVAENIESFKLNEDSYQLSLDKQEICLFLKERFSILDPSILMDVFGKNVKVFVSREEEPQLFYIV